MIELYVTLLMVAALVIGLLAIPSGHGGPVETGFAEGRLSFNQSVTDLTPRIELECQPDGTITIVRYGLPDNLNSAATVALAITRKTFDITIEERITPFSRPLLASETTPVNIATFHLDGLAHERYHIKYNSETTSSFTTVTLLNRPGLRSTRLFRKA